VGESPAPDAETLAAVGALFDLLARGLPPAARLTLDLRRGVDGDGWVAAVDKSFAELIAGRRDREVLELLWRGMDGDGRLLPLAVRARNAAGVAGFPRMI
jgi:hypothetical protein